MSKSCIIGLQRTVKNIVQDKPWYNFNEENNTLIISPNSSGTINENNIASVTGSFVNNFNRRINEEFPQIGEVFHLRYKDNYPIAKLDPTDAQLRLISATDEAEVQNILKELEIEQNEAVESIEEQVSREYLERQEASNQALEREGVIPNNNIPVKEGVEELFNENPELANAVYEALGFTGNITQDNKSYYRGQIEEPIIDKDGNLILYGREDELYKKAGLKSKGVSMTDDLQSAIDYGNGQLDVAMNLASESYDRDIELERLSTEGYWLIQIPKNISNEIVKEAGEVKIIGDKIIIPKGQYKIEQVVEGLEAQITPQQKQQAREQYSQYLDTIFPNSQVKDIVYHYNSSGEKFDKFDKSFIGTQSLMSQDGEQGFSFVDNKLVARAYGEFNIEIYSLPKFVWSTLDEDIYKQYNKNIISVLINPQKGDWKNNQDGWSEIMIKNSDDIHILGSKQDIQGFKEFVNNNPNTYLQERNSFNDLLLQKFVSDVHDEYNKKFGFDEKVDSAYSDFKGSKYDRNTEGIDDARRKADILERTLNAKVIFDDTMESRGALLSSNHPLTQKFGVPVIIINPNRMLSDTVFHEFGHLYIELLGGLRDPYVREAIKKLRGTEFYNEIAEAYPELSGENLDKEVLATALGLEGDKLFERDLDNLTWWQRFINAIKERISRIFKGHDIDYLFELSNEMLSGDTRHDPSTKYESKLNYYSKYNIPSKESTDPKDIVNRQQEIIELFEKLRTEIKTDFEDGKHDYLKDGNIVTNPSISSVTSKIAKQGNNNRTAGNKGDLHTPFNRANYTKDTLLMELGRPTIPLSLAKALDEFLTGDLLGVEPKFRVRNSTKGETPKNWNEQYINEIISQTQTTTLTEVENLLEQNMKAAVERGAITSSEVSEDITFKQDILNNLEAILDRAEILNSIYTIQPTIVGNSLHKAFENIVKGKTVTLPENIKDETGELANTLNKIISEGKSKGSEFFSEQPLWDNNGERAGTADLIEITKEGTFRIYDFKTMKDFLRSDGVTPKSDNELFVEKGYIHQLLAYGNILIDYGIQPAENAYNIFLINTVYSNIKSENDEFTIKGFRLKSMEELGVAYTAAVNAVNKNFKPSINLQSINLKSEIENLGDVSARIHDLIKVFKINLSKKAGAINQASINAIYDDLKKHQDVDFIKEYNKYGTQHNILVIKSFINNIYNTLKTLEDSRINDLSSDYLMGLNYIVQMGDHLYSMKNIIADKVLLEKEGLSQEDAADLINNLNDTINIIQESKEYYQNKLKEMSIGLLAQYSSQSESTIIEILEREARKSGLRGRDEILKYIHDRLPQKKAEIKQREIAYWTAQYENGILDLRGWEAWMMDPGAIKSQFVQTTKKIMDANDMSIRRHMMDLAPEIETWYNSIKDNNPSGGTHKQWSRFINKSSLYNPKTGKEESMLDGTLMSEFISDYMLDKKEMMREVDNLNYRKKQILNKKGKLSNEDHIKLEKLTDQINKIQDDFRTKKYDKKRKGELNYFSPRVNPDFNKLSDKDKETLRYIHKNLIETEIIVNDKNLPPLVDDLGDNVFIFTLPKQRAGYHESLGNGNTTANFVSRVKDIYRPAVDDTDINVSQEELAEFEKVKEERDFNNINTDLEGNSVFNIPIWYRNNLEDPSLQSYDIPTLLLENRQTALNYRQGLELEADMFIIQESLNSKNNNKIIKTDGFLSEKMKNKVGNIYKKSDDNNVYYALRSAIENRLHKRPYIGSYTQKNYMLIKGVEALTRYSSLNSLSFNFKSGLATMAQGSVFRVIEGFVGEHFVMDDWKKGTNKTMKDFHEVVRDSQRHVPKSKSNLLAKHFGLEQNAQLLANKFVQDNFANKNLDMDSLYAVTAISERVVTMNLMYSLLNNIKVMDKDQNYLDINGNITTDKSKAMSLDEAYTIQDGKLVLNPKVTYTTHSLINKYFENSNDTGQAATEIAGYMQGIYADLYGQYNEHLKTMAQRTVIGKMVMSMKGWLPRGIHRRFRGMTTAIPIESMGFLTFEELHDEANMDKRFYSQDLKQFQEGYFSTLMRFVGSTAKHNELKTLGIIGAGKNVWNQLTFHEKANMKRSLIESALMLSLTALTMLMTSIAKGLDDDEDEAAKERMYLLAYMTYRVNDELTTFVNPKSFLNMIQNPAASFNSLNSAIKLIKRMVWLEYEGGEVNWLINDRYERGAKEGDLKITHDTFKLINPINQVKQIGSVLGLDTGKTIEDSFKGQMQANEQ